VQVAKQQALQQANSSGELYISRRYKASGLPDILAQLNIVAICQDLQLAAIRY